MGVFKFDNGTLKLSRVEITAIDEFNEVIRSDRGSEGDSDGRKKYKAFAEFLYIFFVYDYESPHSKLPDALRKEKAIKDAKLPIGWKPTNVVKAAIKRYVAIQDAQSPSNKILISLERGLSLSSKIVDGLVNKMERTLTAIDKAIDAPLPTDGSVIIFPDVTPLVTDMNTLMSLSKTIPESIKAIELIREKVLQEKGSSEVIRGGREKSNREDRKYLEERFKDSLDVNPNE